jgi:hypothetical protein
MTSLASEPLAAAEIARSGASAWRAQFARLAVLAALTLVAACGTALAGYGLRAALSWILGLAVTLAGAFLLQRISRRDPEVYPLAGLAYGVISLIGLAHVAVYLHIYGLQFSASGDDSFYFQQARALSRGAPLADYTLYELLLSFCYRLLSWITPEPALVHLIPFSWALGATATTAGVLLSREAAGLPLASVLPTVVLLTNATWVDTMCHLYRDGLVMTLFSGALIAVLRGRYWLAALGIGLTGFVRFGNALLLGVCALLFWAARTHRKRLTTMKVFAGLTAGVVLLLLLDHYFYLGARLRTPFAGRQPVEMVTLIEMAELREQRFIGEAEAGSDLTLRLQQSSGPVKWLATPLAVVFAPIRVRPPQGEINGLVFGPSGERRPVALYGIRLKYVLEWLTVSMWPVLGPALVAGLWVAFRSGGRLSALGLSFFLGVLSVAFISFQPRHRVIFLVFYPALIELGRRHLAERNAGLALGIATAIALIGFNIFAAVFL